MGKGQIVSHLGAGQYQVTLKREKRRPAARLTEVQKRLLELPLQIVGQEWATTQAKAEYDAAMTALDDIVKNIRLTADPAYATDIKAQITAQQALLAPLVAAQQAYRQAHPDAWDVQIASLEVILALWTSDVQKALHKDEIDQINAQITAAKSEQAQYRADNPDAWDVQIYTIKTEINRLLSHTYDPLIEAAKTQQKIIAEKQKVWQTWKAVWKASLLEQTSLQLEEKSLQGVDLEDPTVAAWCADCTTTLTGEVATAEVPGERGAVLVRPGYAGGSAYSKTRDGQLQPTKAATPASAAYNFALFPGWQKWKPTYRFGTITAISKSYNTCSVLLDVVTSSAQKLGINQATTLTGVPIYYMTCHAAAFAVGSAVLVEFTGQAWSSPRVIGFKANPAQCPTGVYCFMFEKVWFDAWAAAPGPMVSGDMFQRCYFKIDPATGDPFWIDAAAAAAEAYLPDPWSVIRWRDWHGSGNETTDPDYICQDLHHVAIGRNNMSPDKEYFVTLASGLVLSLMVTLRGVAAVTKTSTAFCLPDGGNVYKRAFLSIGVSIVGRWTVDGVIDHYWRGYWVKSETFSYSTESDDKLDSAKLRAKFPTWDGMSSPPSGVVGQYCTWYLDPSDPFCTDITAIFTETTSTYTPPGTASMSCCNDPASKIFGANVTGETDVYRDHTTAPYFHYLDNVACHSELNEAPNIWPLYLRVEVKAGVYSVYLGIFEVYYVDMGTGLYGGGWFVLRTQVDAGGIISSCQYWNGGSDPDATVLYDTVQGVHTIPVDRWNPSVDLLAVLLDPSAGLPGGMSQFLYDKLTELYPGWGGGLGTLAGIDGICKLLVK